MDFAWRIAWPCAALLHPSPGHMCCGSILTARPAKKLFARPRHLARKVPRPWPTVSQHNCHHRALALLHRGWEGDAMAALRDCEAALELDPAAMKAHFRRGQALLACKLLKGFRVT